MKKRITHLSKTKQNKANDCFNIISKMGIVIVFIFTMNSCSFSNDKENTISYWSSNDTREIEFTQYFMEQWNTNHSKKVTVQPIPEGQSSEEVLMAAVVGKTTPDIYANMWQGSVEMFAKAGVLVQLDTIKGFTEFIKKRSGEKTLKEITSSDGHIYQIPWKLNPIMTIYSPKKMNSIGLEMIPKTYSEYLEAAEIFSQDTDGDGYVDQWIGDTEVKNIWRQRLMNFYPLYLGASNGAPLIKDNKVVFNNEHAIGVFAFLQEIYKKIYFAKESNSAGSDKFLAGKIGSKWTGPWDVSSIDKFKPKGFTYAVAPLPVPDNHTGLTYTYSDPKNIVIFNTCKDPLSAWEFIKTLIDDKGDLKFLEITGQLPQRSNITDKEEFMNILNKTPNLIPFAEQAKYTYGIDNCEVLVEVLDIISQEYEACVLYNKKTPEKAIADAAKAVDVLLGNF